MPATEEGAASGDLKRLIIHTLPFGLASLASVLEKGGVPVRMVNDGIEPLTPQRINELAAGEPGIPVFGLSSLTLQAQRCKELHRMIKQTLPRVKVVVGGIHASACPEEFLEAGLDYAFCGEGESVIVELAQRLSLGQDVRDLPGVVWRDEQGRVHRNPRPDLMALGDLPPFPYHLFGDDLKQYDLGAVLASRGCPFNCIFCSQRIITGQTYRTRPAEDVLDEVQRIVEDFGLDYVVFHDDNFGVNKKWITTLCQGLIDRGLTGKARFMCQMRADSTSDELLDLLKRAGFDSLSFGIETGSERMAKVIQKGETVARNAEAVYMAKRHGFACLATFIIGFPTEQAEDRLQTLALAHRLPLDVKRINIAIPYPGTPLYEMVKDRIYIEPGWANFNVVTPLITGPFGWKRLPYVPEGTDESELRFLMIYNNLRFWLSPKGLFSFFFKETTFDTRLPERWYMNPGFYADLARQGFKIVAGLAWCALVGLPHHLALNRARAKKTTA